MAIIFEMIQSKYFINQWKIKRNEKWKIFAKKIKYLKNKNEIFKN